MISVNAVRECWRVHRRILVKRKLLILSGRNYQWRTGVYGNIPGKPDRSPVVGIGNKIFNELDQFLCAYRMHGHKKANINPISLQVMDTVPELDVSRFVPDVEKIYCSDQFLGGKKFNGTITEAERMLENVYSGQVGVEFMHLEEECERLWFQNKWEEIVSEEVHSAHQKDTLIELIKSQILDKFLAIKYVSLKRYGAEGAETQITCFKEIFKFACDNGVKEVVIAAHHRGRLNVLIGLLHMPPEVLFRKLSGKSEFPSEFEAFGDVISHLCPSSTLTFDCRELHIQLTNLPSHLEAVCPVSLGQTRAIQQILGDGDYAPENNRGNQVLNIQVHGDAAFVGQGVSHETLVLSLLPHFRIGGSVHIIINNQLGFTTPSHCGRGTRYATDLAKVTSAPVLHVNGENPESVIKVTKVACEFQRKFRKNVFIDLNCYRRWGHNEMDDPTFTNPLLYKMITNKTSIPDMYANSLMKKGIITETEFDNIKSEFHNYLTTALDNSNSFEPLMPEKPYWKGYSLASNCITTWDTGVDKPLLKMIGLKSVESPKSINVHPNIVKNHINSRLQKIEREMNIDWATAEAMSIGSLLYNGYNVRISGQDVGRGTFSHRHAMMIDQMSDDVYIPLNHISNEQVGHLEIANSLLSEEAVLGFEYGFSSISPNTLVIWEAQFGDFFNGAQIQVDTYVASGEAKWITQSGLIMLLPHGYDGGGPEHSSCRVERFLQLTDSSETHPDGDNVNMHIVNPTTPAQYFHILRRQMIRNYRKPLVVVAPKILLRLPDASSPLDEMALGTSFQPVLIDNNVDFSKVKRLIFTSGKHYYVLKKYQFENNIMDVAIIRLEELSPFPTHQLRSSISKYKNAKEFIWSQEEPRNMGAWTFCSSRFQNLVGCKLKYAGRNEAATPATAVANLHKKEAQIVIERPFE